MTEKNIHGISLDKIYWRCRNSKEFWSGLIEICRDKRIHDRNIWGYAFIHKNDKELKEYFAMNSNFMKRLSLNILEKWI